MWPLKLFFGLLFLHTLCFRSSVCDDNIYSTSTQRAIQRLLLRHLLSPVEPTENILAVTRTTAGFPNSYEYVLPNLIIWDPFVQLPQYFQDEVECPRCVEVTNYLRNSGWKDGRSRRHTPRSIYGMSGTVLIVSREYCCRAGHEIAGHDPAILDKIGTQAMIPYLLSHKTGMTTELIDNIVTMIRNRMTFVQVHDILVERGYMRHLDAERRFLEDFEVYSAKHPVVFDTSFPEFNQSRACPGRKMITNFFLHYFETYERLLIQRMSSTSIEEGWLSCDHTFEVTTNIGYERQEDGKWVKQYDTLFCVLNENGQVMTWQLTQSQSFDKVRCLLEGLYKRLCAQGKVVDEFYVDNCCHWRNKLKGVFGQELVVKLDLFHAFQRISIKISKRHPFHWRCIQDLRLIFRDPTDLGDTRSKPTPDPNTLIRNAEHFIKKWSNVENNSGRTVLSEDALKEVRNVMEHMRKGCLSGIAPGRGTNRNEALHRWLNSLFGASKVGVRLAYALLMIIFDRINNKNDPENKIPEKKCVNDARRRILQKGQSSLETPCETFGIAIDDPSPVSVLEASASRSEAEGPLSKADAIDVLNKAQNKMGIYNSLTSISKSSKISYKQFPYQSTSLNLFFNATFENNQDVEEHDERIENILQSWSMTRQSISKDGDCCFRAVARNICRLRDDGGLNEEDLDILSELKVLNTSEDEMTKELRILTVAEWKGERRKEYEKFLTTDDFNEEVEKFKEPGHFIGELGNLMVLGMSNILRRPIVIFSSLENYPVIPVLPTYQLREVSSLYVSFNSAGCGHYDYVHLKTSESEHLNTDLEQSSKESRPRFSCACGVNKKGSVGETRNICNNAPGSYSSRCKCLLMRVSCGEQCRCKGCSNPFGEHTRHINSDCAPRKRQKFTFQKTASMNSSEFLKSRGEKLRESSMTDAEYFVFEEVIAHLRVVGKDITNELLLESYNFVQSVCVCCEEKMVILKLRKKILPDIKKALASHNHEAEVMSAIFKKQVDLCCMK